MTDKIDKELSKLTSKERETVNDILHRLKSNRQGLQISKLKGHETIFRVRKGRIRIIYQEKETGIIKVLAIERRSEKTYRDF